MSDIFNAVIASYDPASVAAMSKEEAGAALTRLTSIYRDPNPPVVAQPKNAVEAHHKLAALQKEPTWVERFNRSEASAVKDFKTLTEMIANGGDVEFAMAGVVPDNHVNAPGLGMHLEDMVKAVADLRQRGQNDVAIAELLSRKPTPDEHRLGRYNDARRFADPDWVSRLNAKDPQAQSEFIVNQWAIGCYEPMAA